MALDLNGQYSEEGGTLNARIVAALSKEATDRLIAMGSPIDEEQVQFAKRILESYADDVTFVARALISQGITEATLDPQLQTAVSDYYDVFLTMFLCDTTGES